ncbi:MAG: TIGR04053 family radical SAM/SPASM domain-containing protein [Nitriliruptoraceae bacterium]
MSSPVIRSVRHDVHDRPFIVIWEVTRACDLVCRHCRADAQRARHPFELTTAEGFRLLDDLASTPRPHPIVVLTGGDPFAREDLRELVAHGTERGLTMALSPSVTPRLTRSALNDLRAAGARAISLSLDGVDAATHDAFRGVTGVFDATLVAAADVRAAGLRLQVNTTVTRANAATLPGILRHVIDLEASLWSVFLLVPTGRGRTLDALPADDVEDVLHWLCEVSRLVAIKTTEAPHHRRVVLQREQGIDDPVRGPLHESLMELSEPMLREAPPRRAARPPLDVNAGRGFVFVDHLGAVQPSGFLPVTVGSIRDAPLTHIYRDSPVLRRLRDPGLLRGRCGDCEFRAVCGGSRSRAHAVHGDLLGDDPACAYVPTREDRAGAATSSGRVNATTSS